VRVVYNAARVCLLLQTAILAGLAVLAPPEPAAAAKTPPPAAPAPAGPAAIPLPSVIRSAEQAIAAIRRLEAQAEPDPDAEAINADVSEIARILDQTAPLVAPDRLGRLSRRDLADLRQELMRHDARLARWDSQLEAAAGALSGDGQQLRRMQATWDLTRDEAASAGAPAAVLDRIGDVRDRIRGGAGRNDVRLSAALVLQDRVAALRIRLADWVGDVQKAEAAQDSQLFELESAPLWRALSRPGRGASMGQQIAAAFRGHSGSMGPYLREYPERAWLHLAVLLGLAAATWAIRRHARAAARDDPSLSVQTRVFERPIPVALLLGLYASGLIYPRPPAALGELVLLAMLPPFLLATRGFVPASLRRPLYALAGLFAVDRLAALAPEHSLLNRLLLLAVAAAALAVLAAGLRPGSWGEALGAGRWGRAGRLAWRAGAVLLAVSVVANVAGNVALADRLVRGTLTSGAVSVLVLGAAIVLDSALAIVLHVPSVRRIRVVEKHGALLRARGSAAIRLGSVALWIWAAHAAFGIGDAVVEAVGVALRKRLVLGGLDVSLGDVAAFAITLAISIGLARLLRFLLDEEVLPALSLSRGVPAAISKTVQYVMVSLGFAFALLASGMEMTRFTLLAGTLGVGIGFGLQNVVNNFVSGLILIYERPVQVGDVIEVGKLGGEVRRIGFRSSTLRTFQGAEVIVPNANLISSEVINWTLTDRTRRIEVDVGVAYGSDPERVREVLLAALRDRADVLASPEPLVLLIGFGDSALTFQLRFWTRRLEEWQETASAVRAVILRGLGQAGIEIPFPQRDVHLRPAPEP
jgi:small-conductance mechanosensitive channel